MNGASLAQRTDVGPWVFEVPVRLVRRLAALEPKQLADVASSWAETEEFTYDPWEPEVVRWLIEEIAGLCRQAEAKGESLLMWVCL